MYDSSHAILALIRSSKRVGVTSNSHKAVDNLLAEGAEIVAATVDIVRRLDHSTLPIQGPPHLHSALRLSPSSSHSVDDRGSRFGESPFSASGWLLMGSVVGRSVGAATCARICEETNIRVDRHTGHGPARMMAPRRRG
jgi:hypothetical protein